MEIREQSGLLNGLQSYWTERAHSYSTQNVAEMNDWRRDAWRKQILTYAPKKKCLRVLDIGTGPGFFAINLALAGHEVTAVDVTEHMLYHAKENAEDYGAKVNFMLHRGEELPFADESFDLIVNRNVTWNLEYPEKAFAEWARVLADGGRMVYFDANWYLYLFDSQAKDARAKKQEDMAALNVHRGGDMPLQRIKDLERLAEDLPLSRCCRPDWDCEFLPTVGMKILAVDRDVAPGLEDPNEVARDEATPMFMICAEKVKA